MIGHDCISTSSDRRSSRQPATVHPAFEISERILKRIACVATAEATLQDLAGFLRTAFGIDSIDYQWTNEDYESMDGMSAGPALLPITSTSQPDSTPGASPMARRLG